MTLLLQALSAVVAAAALAWWARDRGARVPLAAAVALVAAAVAAFVTLSNTWGADQGFVRATKANSKLHAPDAFLVGGGAAGANVPFVEWLNAVLPPRATYAVVRPKDGADEADYQWLTYRLLPRAALADLPKADFLVFDGTTFADSGYPRSRFGRVMTFGKGLFVAEWRR